MPAEKSSRSGVNSVFAAFGVTSFLVILPHHPNSNQKAIRTEVHVKPATVILRLASANSG